MSKKRVKKSTGTKFNFKEIFNDLIEVLQSHGVRIPKVAIYTIFMILWLFAVKYANKYATELIIFLLIVTGLTLIITNRHFISGIFKGVKFETIKKKKFEMLFKKNDQDFLVLLNLYLNNYSKSRLNLNEVKRIFDKRFATNQHAYSIVFKRVKLSEDIMQYFLNRKLLLEGFVFV